MNRAATKRPLPTDTLAGRLTRTLILWVAGAWLLCVLAVVWYVNHEIKRNFDNELAEISHRMFDIAVRDLDQAAPGRPLETPTIAPKPLFSEDAVIFRVVDARGRTLMQSADTQAEIFAAPPVPGYINNGTWRIYTVAHPTRDLFLQLADPLEERRAAVNHTLLGLLLLLGAMLPLLAWLVRRIARSELRALQWLAAEISQRSGADLRPIPLPDLPQELRSVGDDVNRLLERLAQALDVERALAANAAHELRTPLAAARLRLQTALEHGLRSEDVQAALDALRALSQRAEKLLQLSRAESSASLTREPVDLVQLAGMMAQEFWQDSRTRERLDLKLPATEPPMALGDVDALAIALRNLVENALHYAGTQPVEIEVMAPCTLAVRDFGPGLDAQQLQRLHLRHVRLGTEHIGYGLGLSIVGTIVAKHGARLELLSPPPGHAHGLEARIVMTPRTLGITAQ